MHYNNRIYAIHYICSTNGQVPVSKQSPWQLYNMYSRVITPPYHRCTKFENFLPIICRDSRDIPNFVNFILVCETMTPCAM